MHPARHIPDRLSSTRPHSFSRYMRERWTKSRVTRADYDAARHVLLEELAPDKEDVVLEIGCGPGTWTYEVGRLVKRVVAVEISPKRLEEAKEYTVGLPIEFLLGDFMETPVQGPFTKVFSSRAIEYIADLDRLAEKIVELLAPGGTLVLITKTKYSIWRGRMRVRYRRLRTRPARNWV